jgi:hypothetical protein
VRYSTISQIGSFAALTPASGDYLALDPAACQGGGDAPLRTTTEQRAGGDGVYIFPPFDDAWIITLSGKLVITSAGDESGMFAAEDTLFASLKAALDALKAAPDDLVHSGGTLSVWKNAPIVDARDGLDLRVTFGLIVDVT